MVGEASILGQQQVHLKLLVPAGSHSIYQIANDTRGLGVWGRFLPLVLACPLPTDVSDGSA